MSALVKLLFHPPGATPETRESMGKLERASLAICRILLKPSETHTLVLERAARGGIGGGGLARAGIAQNFFLIRRCG